ncbi:MAG: RND family transporter [Deltaproteobacteria bacterium]|nr:RND family transporter [Deltaproteobacteria bacterium]
MKYDNAFEQQPVIDRLEAFDIHSGNRLERLLFNNRLAIVAVCMIITIVLGLQATRLRLNASFERMIPTQHPYIVNYFENKNELPGLGNSIRIAVETVHGTIFDAVYLEMLRRINDESFFIPGADRSAMKSLWTPATRWAEVTEDGLTGGPVMPDTYDGSPASVGQVRANVEKSGQIGQLVAANFKSSMIILPMLDIDPETGKPIDYQKLSHNLEKLRSTFQSDKIKLHITGFAKIAGDLMDGLRQVMFFFALATLIATVMVFWFTRCVRSTLLVVISSIIAVVWQLGLVRTFGFELDPYSMIVPFLIFSIGMSHGAQKMNGIMQDIGRGTYRVIAARYTFRRLFVAGITALLCDAVGFGILMIIQIGVIQQLALMASMGVAVLIFTNLVLLPIMLSFTGVSPKAAARSLKSEAAALAGEKKHPMWRLLDLFTHRKWATVAIVISILLGGMGYVVRSHLQIGDLDAGAPELRPDSRYNQDNAFVVANYASSSDVLVVMVKTPANKCGQYDTLIKVDALEWDLQQVSGVESTSSMAGLAKQATVGMNEGSLKWYEILNNQNVLNAVTVRAPRDLFNQNCNMLSLFVFLKDHKADTLTGVIKQVEKFAKKNNSEDARFLLAAGNAGIEAATNIVVKDSMATMLYWVYGAVIILCFVTFRSWQAVCAAVIPLVLTSFLCETLMVWLKIGVKVSTLPVIALGVGIGVDYALYVLSVVMARMREGMSLSEAYYQSLLFTGKVVILTGLTLAMGVATWAFSPIKFQADMGILLSFMFLWNMLGALILLPALARFLLIRRDNPEK